MKKIYIFIVLSPVLLLFLKTSCFAQSLPVGMPVIEDYYRRKQLLGGLDSSVSFMIRPLFPVAAFQVENVFDPDNGMGHDNILSNRVIYSSPDNKSSLQLLPFTWQQQYNTHNPYGWNDGPMIPAAGYQTLFSPGIYYKYKFVSIQFQPEFVYAQNKNFDGFTQAGNDNTAWQAWYALNNAIDMPERFGTGAYAKLFPGQSSIRINFDPISFGISTEDLWWGPGVWNSLIMSNNAPGFLHFTLNTTRPIKTPIGSFEFQLIGGKLVSSGYSPLVPGQPGNHDTLYTAKPADWRYLSGGVFTYQPKWVPGLFLGMTRVLQDYENRMTHSFASYIPFFLSTSKESYVNPATGMDSEIAGRGDQIASAFVRWIWPSAHAEIYLEYGREDFSWNTRDLLLDPEHSRAYLFGFKKLFSIANRPDEYMQVSFETTQLAKPPDDLQERNTTPDWYANYLVVAGYTNDGQVLGAGIGPGSNLQTLDISWFKGLEKIGLQLNRYEHSEDFYYNAFPGGETRRHWVDYSAGLTRNWSYQHFVFSANLLYVLEFNYEWELHENPYQSYFNQPFSDAKNINANISVSYRF